MIYFIFILYILLSALGMVLIKYGGLSSQIDVNKSIFALQLSWHFIIGNLLYLVSFFLWIYILQKFRLTLISPMAYGLVFLVLTLFSFLFLKEQIKIQTLIGAAIIIVGVFITYMGK